ncbi:PREDICTED: uncharacterized protein LOC109193984 [Ipomoea nil]|uniref:uncharacterized protein LOC109193984 n=1 Tax=Ipomoea nil TaxID=35883 RepID=UPI000901C1E4|nr:PREDICTED: uncharacterized protein LOC109193984 [Ipomoea nil]
MVLRITVFKSTPIVKAIQAAAVVESPTVIFIWRPEGLCVQSMLADKLDPGDNLSTLLRLEAQTFSSYESTDQYFSAVVERVDLEAVFLTANDSERIEFSQSDEDNKLNGFGYLHARFDRPVGAYKENYISLKIYGIFSESMLRSADVSADPSFLPLLPLAGISAPAFADAIAVMESMAEKVLIIVKEGLVFFAPVDQGLMPLMLGPKNGVIYTMKDLPNESLELEIKLPFLNIHSASELSSVVFLSKRAENVLVVWFKLEKTRYLLSGDIIYYWY